MIAAGIIAVNKQSKRKALASPRSLSVRWRSVFCSRFVRFATTLGHHGEGYEAFREVFSFNWIQFGGQWTSIGWVLDPLTAIMLVMVTFVGMLIFIFSVGYMAHDQNFMRFFCFLALFASGMLGVVIANNLLLFFVSWEIVGLTSYLLIGFGFTNRVRRRPQRRPSSPRASATWDC